MKQVVIIGNGISGITAARNIRKLSDFEITVISAETDYFFSRTALMYVFMGHMKFEHIKPYEDWFWKKNNINLINAYVNKIDVSEKKLYLSGAGTIEYSILILALGSVTQMFGWPGQDLKGVQGLYSYQDLVLMEENVINVKHAVITGGGLIGVEMAEMLMTRGVHVTFLVREKGYWQNLLPEEESQLVSRHLRSHGVELKLESELEKIIGDENGHVVSVKTNHGEILDCEFVGLTAGVKPNIKLLEETTVETSKGIMVDLYLETSVEDIYAIGDCAEMRMPEEGRISIEAVWYAGRMMGETIAHTVSGHKTAYKPGKWFNSAKFFDIEYQTYGNVGNVLHAGEDKFYWEDASGTRCLKLVFDKETNILKGINVFGLRMRHEVCDRWLRENRTIFYVMEHMKEADFNPEFSSKFDREILDKFNEGGFGAEVVLSKNQSVFSKFLGF